VTDDKQKTKIEDGNSKLDGTRMAPRASNLDLRVSLNSPQKTKIENGNSQLEGAQIAPRASNFDLRVPVLSPRLTSQQLQFLLRVTPAALASQRQYEIPACVTLAQAILESATPKFGWGSSVLFRVANNPFGIKYSHLWQVEKVQEIKEVKKVEVVNSSPLSPSSTSSTVGQVEKVKEVEAASSSTSSTFSTPSTPSTSAEDYGHFDAQTWEIENGQKKVIIAQFQRFPNLDEAFRAHALLLRAPRYRPAFDVRDDWKQFAERLGPKTSPLDTEHCGYSTNPSYSAELIKSVSLYRLNDPRALEWYATGKDPGYLAIEPSDHRVIGSLSDLAIK
jgi:flagellum-specific peptidoglycan hydrolase FlgJ